MPATKKAKRVRQSSEFQPQRLLKALAPPSVPACAYSWDLATIMSARDAQIAGHFALPVRLAVSMRTDDALLTAYKNRLAPQRSLSVRVAPGRGARADAIAAEAEALFGQGGIAIGPEALADIHGDLANHGVAVAYCTWLPRDDGSRIDVEVKPWPLEFVMWDSSTEQLVTQVDSGVDLTQLGSQWGGYVPIVHGDGRWIVFRTHELMPWRQDAAILAAALVWARHAFGARDWSKGSATHGNAKVVGQLPEGVPLQVSDGAGGTAVSDEASAFLSLLQDVASLDCPVGIAPAGSKIDYLTNSSRAWEVWSQLMLNAEKAAARIYLGTDGTLGSQGGAPGVDISQLFGVATTIVQGDLAAIERGLRTGAIEPWCALNFGDSGAAPSREYVIPDPDAEQVREKLSANESALCKAISERKAAGFEVTQDWVDALADSFGVARLQLAAVQAIGFQLAPTDLARVVTANEARSTVGLPARMDGEVPMATFGQPAVAPAVEPL
jgi:hypothetical protein